MAENGEVGSTENLRRVIEDLRALSEDIESCAVLSRDGDLIYSSPGAERERAAAMLATLVNLAERTARESGRDRAVQVRIKAGAGYLLMVSMEDGGTLAATTGLDARVGLVLYDMRNSRNEIEKAITEGTA
ncbi:MAG: roadblock/LC7 domain-containing protein [Rubrobacteraceae bacterium]